MIPSEICDLIVELNKYRTGYGELSQVIDRIQTKFEQGIVEIYRKMDAKMSAVENLEDTEMRETKYPHLRVATGGKNPPEGPTNNWLAELEVRTSFVARHRNNNDVDYNQYYILFKSLPEVVLLKWILPDGKLLDYYVDPVRFSKMFPDYVVLGIDKIQEPQEEAEVTHDSPE